MRVSGPACLLVLAAAACVATADEPRPVAAPQAIGEAPPPKPDERCKQPVDDASCYCLVTPGMPRCAAGTIIVPAEGEIVPVE